MIHIIKKYSEISEHYEIDSVWDVDCEDAEEDYKAKMINFAEKDFNIVINPHWLNIMSHKEHHPILSAKEYKRKEKEWGKFLGIYTIEWHIGVGLKGKRLEFKTANSQ